jgi:hypothetical protein
VLATPLLSLSGDLLCAAIPTFTALVRCASHLSLPTSEGISPNAYEPAENAEQLAKGKAMLCT